MPEWSYGFLVSLDGTIEIFNYTQYSKEVQISVKLRRLGQEEILSHYFNRTDGSLIVIGKTSGLTRLINTPIYDDVGIKRIESDLW